MYFENLFEFFGLDEHNGYNHGYCRALYFLHALVTIVVQDLFYDTKQLKNSEEYSGRVLVCSKKPRLKNLYNFV